MARIIWSLRAIENLEEICEYISKDSQKAAEKLVKEVRSRVASLSTSPFIGRIVPEQKKGVDKNLREILLGNYRIVYQVDVDVVNILIVFHAKRDFNADSDVKP